MPDHEHSQVYYPASGTGYEVCECGATRRVENHKPVTPWNAWEPAWHNPGWDPEPEEPDFPSAVTIGHRVVGDAVWDRPEPEPEGED